MCQGRTLPSWFKVIPTNKKRTRFKIRFEILGCMLTCSLLRKLSLSFVRSHFIANARCYIKKFKIRFEILGRMLTCSLLRKLSLSFVRSHFIANARCYTAFFHYGSKKSPKQKNKVKNLFSALDKIQNICIMLGSLF